MSFRKSNRQSAAGGQAIVMLTLSLPLVLALVGFVVDVGWAHFRKQACQSAAEAAAFAGAIAAQNASNQTCGNGWTCQSATACPSSLTTPNDPVQAACLYAQANGFTNGAKNGYQSVKVAANKSSAQSSGVTGVSPSYWVAVTVREKLPLTFLSVLGQQFTSVAYQSIAGTWTPSASGCIYTLDPHDTDISMNGTTSITTGCGVYDNSDGTANGSSVSIVGNGPGITATGGASVNIVGALTTVSTHSNSQISPWPPNTGVSSITDPFSSMTAPTPASSCTSYSGQATLSAGTYCSISLNNGSLTLNPGVYIITGGIDIGARSAALYTSQNSSTATDQPTACTYALDELKISANLVGTSGCNSDPLIVSASKVSSGPDGNAAASVTVSYHTLSLIPIPSFLSQQFLIVQTVEMRLRG
jgi:Flp pilus assembly protein TadG